MLIDTIRIDTTTLTWSKYDRLLNALLQLNAIQQRDLRNIVVEQLHYEISGQIKRQDANRHDAMAIWDTCSQLHVLPDLLRAIELVETKSPAFTSFQDVLGELKDFVKRTAIYYDRYKRLATMIQNIPAHETSVATWCSRIQAPLMGRPDIKCTQPVRDLLLELGDLPADPHGDSFPLFVFVESLLSDLFTGKDLTDAQAILTHIAQDRKVTVPGIAKLRKAVQDMRNPNPSGSSGSPIEVQPEPALLVVIEPHDDITGAPPYRLHFYQWEPWDTEELRRAAGTAGRGICIRDPSPYLTREQLEGEISTALGALLREIHSEPLCVEFVVPKRLLCEAFEHIKVDLLGGSPGLEPAPEELGVIARVVVRSWERLHTAFPPQLCEQWRRRWRHVQPRELRACQLDPGSNAFTLLQLNANREVPFLWVAFAPVCPIASQEILMGLLKGGVPISLWRREEWCGTDTDAVGQELAKVVKSTEPTDLRDRVFDMRVQALNAAARPHLGECLTLFWDDPDRVPPRGKSVPSPLR